MRGTALVSSACGNWTTAGRQRRSGAHPVAPAQAAPGTSTVGTTEHSDKGDQNVHLDVVVTDKAGEPVPVLSQADFTVLDNDQPRKIRSFEAHTPGTHAAGPPTQVIILFDTVNAPFESVSYARRQVGAYLSQNEGRLSVPVSIYFLTDTTVVGERQASTDGKAIAAQLEATESRLRAQNREVGVWGYLEAIDTRQNDGGGGGDSEGQAGAQAVDLGGPRVADVGRARHHVFNRATEKAVRKYRCLFNADARGTCGRLQHLSRRV